MQMKNMVDWSQAPNEMLGLIAGRINSVEDYVRFGAVCKTLQSVILDQRRLKYSPKTLPWLMFPRHDNELEDGSHIENPNFFSLSENKYYKFESSEARNCCLTGSPYGWLILAQRGEIYNPLTRVRIPLPLPYKEDDHNLYQFAHLVMSCSTSSPKDQFIVVVNFFQSLAFVRAGDVAWTDIEISNVENDDIVHLNNVFYIIDFDGIIRSFDVTNPNPVATEFVQPPDELKMDNFIFYLVELLGELHVVAKSVNVPMLSEDHHSVTGPRYFDKEDIYFFRVFKLDITTKKWRELISLGDYTIFVGQNASFSVRASDFSHVRRSCIYFSESRTGATQSTGDIGIFDLETGGTELLLTGAYDVNVCGAPVWFIPRLC